MHTAIDYFLKRFQVQIMANCMHDMSLTALGHFIELLNTVLQSANVYSNRVVYRTCVSFS